MVAFRVGLLSSTAPRDHSTEEGDPPESSRRVVSRLFHAYPLPPALMALLELQSRTTWARVVSPRLRCRVEPQHREARKHLVVDLVELGVGSSPNRLAESVVRPAECSCCIS